MGYLQERKVGGLSVFEEKGVDIDLAVDMLSGAFEDRYDTAILVSSDGDFKPVVQAVQRRGKRVEYVFFPKAQRSNALASTCNVSRRCPLGPPLPRSAPPCTPHLRAPSLAPTPSPSHHRRPLPFSTRLRSSCRRPACGGLPAEGGEALEERHHAAP